MDDRLLWCGLVGLVVFLLSLWAAFDSGICMPAQGSDAWSDVGEAVGNFAGWMMEMAITILLGI